ncbi:myb-like domain, Myb/SANT-like DNA-binding domain protein [Artemisia annua]|uniref:Myb-like domain, Myb/SANT-like DNA-binding domain protein n=1 Tax=Artemisia annua TaxID=35608 RepID=A0A2U1QAA0_ARTAN|nr:myb-like domain, Myb/SANT-like DNA-binding domain protein [Artemisia annua]
MIDSYRFQLVDICLASLGRKRWILSKLQVAPFIWSSVKWVKAQTQHLTQNLKCVVCKSSHKINLNLEGRPFFCFLLWIGEQKLETLFPRLFSLEVNKDRKVMDCCNLTNGPHTRPVRDGVKKEQSDGLLNILHHFNRSSSNDYWEYSIDASGIYSVSSLKRYIEGRTLMSVMNPVRWNKSVPLKGGQENDDDVEVVEEIKNPGKAKNELWSTDEEVALAKAWVHISTCPKFGNEQKSVSFWGKILEHFTSLMGNTNRTHHSLNTKWKHMNAEVNTFNGLWIQSL